MDHVGLPEDLTDKIVDTIFKDFMTRYARHEELVDAGGRFLRGFYQTLEILRRTPLSKASNLADEVIKDNYTNKLKECVEASFTNREDAIQSISKLHSCKLGLEDHLMKANVLLEEVESLKNNAMGIVAHGIDTKARQSNSIQEDSKASLLLDESMSRATLMAIIYGMLKLEFAMQEKIIKSLNLMTTSSVLESYCLFWELRPDIYDNVLHQAWKYVSG